MLPFLKNKQQSIAGLIIKQRTPDQPEEQSSEMDVDAGLEECASALIKAVHNRDTKGVMQAIKDAYIILEAQEHEEMESEEHEREEAE